MDSLDMTPCSLVGKYRRVGENCHLHFGGRRGKHEQVEDKDYGFIRSACIGQYTRRHMPHDRNNASETTETRIIRLGTARGL
jgi:hypothetical protein